MFTAGRSSSGRIHSAATGRYIPAPGMSSPSPIRTAPPATGRTSRPKSRAIALADSARLYSPRWSPDGRYLVALTADYQKLVLYDFSPRKWEDVAQVQPSYPNWSKDGRYIYFNNAFERNLPFNRIRMSDHKVEYLVNLGDYGRLAIGRFGWWTGLAPDDSLLAIRDIRVQEIYALNREAP